MFFHCLKFVIISWKTGEAHIKSVFFICTIISAKYHLTRRIIGSRRDLLLRLARDLLPRRDRVYPFFIASIPRCTYTLANGCGQITVLPAFETLLTLRILARRARLTSLCPVENDDITIKLPSAYGNWLNYQISSTNINTSTPRDPGLWLRGSILNDMNLPVRTIVRRAFIATISPKRECAHSV